ncbi:MAG: hypothetical protein ACRD04_02995 [Terriglobales bacterium]
MIEELKGDGATLLGALNRIGLIPRFVSNGRLRQNIPPATY